MRIYIAGPYTKGDVILNIRNAIEAGEEVLKKGHVPHIPHLTAYWHMVFPHDVKFWYEYDFHWLRCCEALLRISGESEGADAEVRLAKDLLMPVYYDLREVPYILEERRKTPRGIK